MINWNQESFRNLIVNCSYNSELDFLLGNGWENNTKLEWVDDNRMS